MRREIGEILAMLVERKDGAGKVEGSACPGHIRICPRVAPKHSAGKAVGKLKGEGAAMLFGRRPEWRGKTGRGRSLWARGRYVSTVGLNETVIRKHMQKQEDGSKIERGGRPPEAV